MRKIIKKRSKSLISNYIDKNKSIKFFVLRLIIIILAIVGVILLNSFSGLLFERNIFCNDVQSIFVDNDNNKYIINDSGNELLKVSADNKVIMYLKGTGRDFSFNVGTRAAVDDDGNIYITNYINDDNAVTWYGSENIVVYNKYGIYKDTILNHDYDNPQAKLHFNNLIKNKDGIYAVFLDKDRIEITNVQSKETINFDYENAYKKVNKVCFGDNINSIYAINIDGKIVKIDSNGYKVLTSNSADKSNSTLWGLNYGNNNNLLFINLWNNSLYSLNTKTLFSEKINSFDNRIYDVTTKNDNSFVCNAIYSIIEADNDSVKETDSFSISLLFRFLALLFYLCLVIIIIITIRWIFLGLIKILKNNNSKIKKIFAIAMGIVIVTLIFCTIVFQSTSDMMMKNVVENEKKTALTAANLIPKDSFCKLKYQNSIFSEDYYKVKDVADTVVYNENGVLSDNYLIIYTLNSEGEVVVRFSTEATQGCNYPYIWSEGEDEAYTYETKETTVYEDIEGQSGTYTCVYTPLIDSKGDVIAVLEVGCDTASMKDKIRKTIFEVALGILVLSVIILLLFLEIIEFNDAKNKTILSELKRGKTPPYKLYRIAVFLVFFVTNITTPFLSIYSLRLAEESQIFAGISPEIMAAVPISAEVLFGAIFSLTGSGIIRKYGNRKSAIGGALIFSIGLAIRFIYPNLIFLTIGNAIQGAGWGIVLLIINTMIAQESDEKLQEEGFADYNAALQNGLNSGIVAGGFLLLFFSYNKIMIIVAILSLAILIFSFKYIYDSVNNNASEIQGDNNGYSYFKFILSPKVFLYFSMIVIPVIAASYYLNFLYPILAERLGMEESIIGYSYLINGAIVICFGNLIVRNISKYFSKKILLMIASLIYFVTFALIGLFNNITVLLLSLVLLAVSDSFGYVAQETIYTEMKETKLLGYDRAMGVYSLIENLSQTIGSFIFGYILVVGVKSGMAVYGIVIGITGLIFALCYRKGDNKNEIT